MKIRDVQIYFEKFFNIHKNERRSVHLFFIYIALISSFYTIGISISQTLFLKKLDLTSMQRLLPWVYLSSGFVILVVSLFFSKFIEKFSRITLIFTIKIAFASSLLLFWSFLKIYATQKWLYFSLSIWVDSISAISLSMFYSYLGDFFNIRDARRLYGYIMTGLALGGSIGGFIVIIFTKFLPVINLLFLSGGLALLCIFVVYKLSQIPSPHFQSKRVEVYERSLTTLKVIFLNKYILLIFFSVLIKNIFFIFSDYQMLIVSSNVFDEIQLANFFGTFFSGIGIVQLFIQLFFSGYFLQRFGVMKSLLILPLLLLASCISFIISPILFFSALIHFIYLTIGDSQDKTSKEILFLLLADRLRIHSQLISSGVIAPLGNMISACVLIFTSFYFIPIQYYVVLLIILSLMWLLGVIALTPQYAKTLANSLWRRFSDSTDLKVLLSSRESFQYIKNILLSNDKTQILLILSFLPAQSFQNLSPELQKLAQSDDEDMASQALYLMAQYGLDDGTVMSQFLNDPRPMVLEAAIIGYCKLRGEKVLERIEPYFESANLFARAAAIVGCYKYGGSRGKGKSRRIFLELLKSDPLLATKVISEIGITDYRDQLNNLLLDSNIKVRIEAIKVCIKIPETYFLNNLIINFLDHKSLRPLIIEALSALPQDAVSRIQKEILEPTTAETLRSALLRGLGNIGGPKAEELIVDVIMSKNTQPLIISATFALRNLFLTRHLSTLNHINKCREHILKSAYILKEAYKDMGAVDPTMRRFFLESFHFYIEILLTLISIQYGIKEIMRITQFVISENNRELSTGLELLESILPRAQFLTLADLLTPLLSETDYQANLPTAQHIDELLTLDRWVSNLTLTLISKNPENQNLRKGKIMEKAAKNIIELVDFVTFLKKSELFKDIPSHYLSVFKEIFKEVSLYRGESLFQEGDAGDSLYLIRQGTVSIQQKNKELSQLGEGSCIGELALLDHLPRSATVIALEDTEFLKLTSQDFDDILLTYPEVSLGLLKILATRLRQMNVMSLGQGD